MAVLKVEPVAEKIRECEGNLAAVGRHFGVCRSAVHRFVRKNESLMEVCAEAREAMKDEAESSLYRAVKAGESWAVCFFLKCQAKDRGYIEKVEEKRDERPVTASAAEIAAAYHALASGLPVAGVGHRPPPAP